MSWISDVREQFPQLKRKIRGRDFLYFDSAATSLKPRSVIQAMEKALSEQTANVHRGAHALSDEATEIFEGAREKVRRFLNARSTNEIVFVRGTTEGLNLVAHSLAPLVLKPGDEILLSQMEHHSNIVPWQLAAERLQAKVRFVPVLDNGALDEFAFKSMLTPRVKIVSLVHLSNALGTYNPIEKLFGYAKAMGAVTVLDAAQSVPGYPIDVQKLNCDFLAFSAHKMFGPTGIGVLYGKESWLEKMPPYQGGGSMIGEVSEQGSTFLPPPHRFEAGTPAIAEAFCLGAAIDFLTGLGYGEIAAHERRVMEQIESGLNHLPKIRQIGRAPDHRHLYSFVVEGAHPSDVGSILDEQGIAVRAGHHCCQPLMKRFSIPGTVRASFSVYTDEYEIAELVNGIKKAMEMLI